MLDNKDSAALIQHPIPASASNALKATQLRNKKDFVRVRIFNFRSRRESFDIDILARRIGTLYEVRLARNRNSVRVIPLCNLRWRGRRRRRSGCGLHRRCTSRLNRAVWIEWLLRRRVLFGLGGGIIGHPMSGGRWLRLFTACGNQEGREQGKRQ